MASLASCRRVGRDDAGEPEASGEAHGTHVHAPSFLDRGPVPERELGAAAAGVEDRAASPSIDGRLPTAARYASRLSSSPEMVVRSRPVRSWIRFDDLRRSPRCARPRWRRRRSRVPRASSASSTMPWMAVAARSNAAGVDIAPFAQALPEAGDLGTIDARPATPSASAFADVELDRIRADVDDGEALGRAGQEVGEALRVVRVAVAVEAHRADGRARRPPRPPTRWRSSGWDGHRR